MVKHLIDCVHYGDTCHPEDLSTTGCRGCPSYIKVGEVTGRAPDVKPEIPEPRIKKTYRLKKSTILRLRRAWAENAESFDTLVDTAINEYLDTREKE